MKLMTKCNDDYTDSFEVQQNAGLEANFQDANQFGIRDLQCIKKLKSGKKKKFKCGTWDLAFKKDNFHSAESYKLSYHTQTKQNPTSSSHDQRSPAPSTSRSGCQFYN